MPRLCLFLMKPQRKVLKSILNCEQKCDSHLVVDKLSVLSFFEMLDSWSFGDYFKVILSMLSFFEMLDSWSFGDYFKVILLVICSESVQNVQQCSESVQNLFRIFRHFRISSTKTGLFRISWLCSDSNPHTWTLLKILNRFWTISFFLNQYILLHFH
jgi:hypothetical protein